MNWLKTVLLKILKASIMQFVQCALDKATEEAYEEINNLFKDESQRETLKSGIVLLRSRFAKQMMEKL